MSADLPSPSFVPPGYRIVKHLGSGQTSNVYLAHHAQRGAVALKLPRPGLHEKPVLRRMFENEVQITLSLKHDYIVRALDGYPTGPKAFLELEYCVGGTLDQRLVKREAIPLEEAYQLILDVALGLAYSHQRNVLHRDVKPANVFLSGEGQAKLGDFGTGAYLTEVPKERVGTAFYMAPEVFQGQPSSVYSDIYSLGILAYEVIAGVRPFTGENYDTIMLAHLSKLPKPLRHHREGVRSGVSQVIACAMARDPDKRFASAKGFCNAFSDAAQIVPGQPSGTPPIGRGGRSRHKHPQPAEQEEGPITGLMRWFRRKKR